MPSTLTVLASGALLLRSVGSAAVPCSSPQYLVTFGDSYSQTGFNTSLAKPTASNPLGNPALPGWTSSGGLNYVGQLAGKTVGNGGAAPVLSYNFADGGATTDSAIVAPYTPTVRSFVDQVAVFEQTLGARPRPEGWADWTAEDALFGVWMGVNDVGNSHWLANATDVVDALTLRYFDGLDALYEAGGRNFYLLTVPREFFLSLKSWGCRVLCVLPLVLTLVAQTRSHREVAPHDVEQFVADACADARVLQEQHKLAAGSLGNLARRRRRPDSRLGASVQHPA